MLAHRYMQIPLGSSCGIVNVMLPAKLGLQKRLPHIAPSVDRVNDYVDAACAALYDLVFGLLQWMLVWLFQSLFGSRLQELDRNNFGLFLLLRSG